MAIKRVLTRDQTEIRAPLPEAYCKVHDVEIRLSGSGQVFIHVLTYADKTARDDAAACSVNKETVRVSLDRFSSIGRPSGWSKAEIVAAAYGILKAEGFTGEDC